MLIEIGINIYFCNSFSVIVLKNFCLSFCSQYSKSHLSYSDLMHFYCFLLVLDFFSFQGFFCTMCPTSLFCHLILHLSPVNFVCACTRWYTYEYKSIITLRNKTERRDLFFLRKEDTLGCRTLLEQTWQ